MLAEAVEVQTVIPVCTADLRETMRPFMSNREIKGSLQVFHERLCLGDIVIKRNGFFQNRDISGFSDIGACSGDEPERIVIEAAADIRIAFLGQRLILVISRTILKLGRGDIDDALSCPIRNQMHEAEQVLVGITEAHASADAGFIVRSRAGHVECDHALVLIPDVHHAVHFVVLCFGMVDRKQISPVVFQFLESVLYLLIILVAINHCPGTCLVDDALGFPFLVFRILDIAEHEDKGSGFSWFQIEADLMCSNRRPA